MQMNLKRSKQSTQNYLTGIFLEPSMGGPLMSRWTHDVISTVSIRHCQRRVDALQTLKWRRVSTGLLQIYTFLQGCFTGVSPKGFFVENYFSGKSMSGYFCLRKGPSSKKLFNLHNPLIHNVPKWSNTS